MSLNMPVYNLMVEVLEVGQWKLVVNFGIAKKVIEENLKAPEFSDYFKVGFK